MWHSRLVRMLTVVLTLAAGLVGAVTVAGLSGCASGDVSWAAGCPSTAVPGSGNTPIPAGAVPVGGGPIPAGVPCLPGKGETCNTGTPGKGCGFLWLGTCTDRFNTKTTVCTCDCV